MGNTDMVSPEEVIYNLLLNTPDADRKALQQILLKHLSDEDKRDYEGIIAGERLPSFMSDSIAKRLFDADIHSGRLEYLFRETLHDQAIKVDSSFRNEGYIQSTGSKKVVFDLPSLFADGRRGDLEFQVSAQDFILNRGEIYGSDMLLLQYSVQPDERKSALDYSGVRGVALVVLMRHSPKPFKSYLSKRYIHRFVKSVSDSGLCYEPLTKTVYVQLDKCLEQFRCREDGEDNHRLQVLLSLLADSNDPMVLKEAENDPFFSDMISEAKDMVQGKEVQAMMLAEKYAIADINAVKHYERQEGYDEGYQSGRENGVSSVFTALDLLRSGKKPEEVIASGIEPAVVSSALRYV